MRDVDPSQFRELCGRFPTGVVIVTAIEPDGRPVGMTASSFTSVSLRPPLVSLNVDRAAELHHTVHQVTAFAINILEASQAALSRRFAEMHPDRFEGVGYQMNQRGLPILDGTLANLECERAQLVDAGDHTIVIARVVGGNVREGHPLLYYRGGYHTSGLG